LSGPQDYQVLFPLTRNKGMVPVSCFFLRQFLVCLFCAGAAKIKVYPVAGFPGLLNTLMAVIIGTAADTAATFGSDEVAVGAETLSHSSSHSSSSS
jgi:hypothetical protein